MGVLSVGECCGRPPCTFWATPLPISAVTDATYELPEVLL
jgi:hypothetical protein